MNEGGRVHPEADAWVVAVHASLDDYEPRGTGIVVDDLRILTCAHVIEGLRETWVAFPKAEENADTGRRRVERVVLPAPRAPVKDLALLVLSEPVPAGVTAAPLRCPKPADLIGKRWWAFGFPSGDPVGSAADGQVGSALAHGWVRLDTASRYPVERGFSGGGLWSSDYRAVVAVVSHANAAQGDGRAITIHQADLWFPDQKLRTLAERYVATDAGEVALSAWGWSLSGDSEATRHWRPRARGVSIDSERGYRFRGRAAALRSITAWLDRTLVDHHVPDRRVLVITGAPGAGKSAVLGRIVTTADPEAVAQLPASDTAVRATPGSVACAVHAKGQTALEIATKIAKAASAAIPERVEDFVPALRDALTERADCRFNVIIDALDEAASPAEARLVVSKVIAPMTETCADVGAQVVVGSRRSDADGDLMAAFGGAAKLVDLDKPEFFAREDLAAYVHATLQLAGDERQGNPYTDDTIAALVADRIAAQSDGNFLVAGLTARTHGLYDQEPADPATLSFSPKVDDAMREYLRRIPPVVGISAEKLLTALAYAESPGLPGSLWRAAVQALGFGNIPEAALRIFARSSAASFLVESSGTDGAEAEFRLFHQALNDALLHARATIARPREDEQALTRAFIHLGREGGWDRAPAYLLRSLPAHAARAGLLDELVADDGYLLCSDLLRVQPLASQAISRTGRQRERLLRLSPRDVITAGPLNRAAMFSVTEALEGLAGAYTAATIRTPYRAAWAAAPESAEYSVLRGHSSRITAICAFTLNGATLLAVGDRGGTVRIWDPATGTERRALIARHGEVTAICALPSNGTTLLATSYGGTVRIWDPATGTERRALIAHDGEVTAICALPSNGNARLALGTKGGTVRIWDPTDGTERHAFTASGYGSLSAICALTLNGITLLAISGSWDVEIWDPAEGTKRHAHSLTEYRRRDIAMCALTLNGTTLLAAGDWDGVVRVWDPAEGTERYVNATHQYPVSAICALPLSGTTVIASCDEHEGTVKIWDPADGTERHDCGRATAICALTMNGTTLLVTGDRHGTVRIWDPADGTQRPAYPEHDGWVTAICALSHNGTTFLATSDDGGVRIWDPATGTRRHTLTRHGYGRVTAVCALTLDGTTFVATSDENDGAIRIWDPATGAQRHILAGHEYSRITAMCALTLNGTTYLATSDDDETIRIWNPATRARRQALTKYEDCRVTGICALTLNGTAHLATSGGDGTIRIWDAATGTERHTLTAVTAITAFSTNGTTDLLAASRSDLTIRIWNPTTGTQHHTLIGHKDTVTAVCALPLNGTALLATTSHDCTVRIWDPAKGTSMLVVPTRDEALSVAYDDGLLFVGTGTGLLAIKLDPDFLSHSAS